MFKSTVVALATLASIFSLAAPVCAGEIGSNITEYGPPKLEPFLHITAIVNLPVNASTINGITAFAANLGGNVTGGIEGDLIPIGAASEVIPPAGEGAYSLYENTWVINTTTTHQTIIMNGKATISYANNALRGFGTISFSSDAPEYLDLNWRNFVVEFQAPFNTGKIPLDVFELVTTREKL